MKIRITHWASSGGLEIPPGEYLATLIPEAGEITLVGGGLDFRVKAIKRSHRGYGKRFMYSWYNAGGKTWSLTVSTPKQGDWIAMFELNKEAAA